MNWYKSAQEEYKGSHRAPGKEGARADDLTMNGVYPADVYTRPDWYESDEGLQEMYKIIRLRGRPDGFAWIYRAVPLVLSNAEKIADIEKQKAEIQRRGYERWAKKQENPLTYDQLNAELDRLKSLPEEVAVVKPQINNGDWVTTNKKYAQEHGDSALNGEYVVVARRVRARDIYTEGNSIFEWGYNP